VEERQRIEERRAQAEQRSYKGLMDADRMETNTSIASKYATAEEFEDDFM